MSESETNAIFSLSQSKQICILWGLRAVFITSSDWHTAYWRKAELLPYSRMTTALRVGHALLLKSHVSELLSPMLNHGLNANGCYAKNFYYFFLITGHLVPETSP
ncbi:hypothetical protein AVEN_53318-1 [Araneus ventricosus]|uniref:Uncharacterized protein n=1 Tax=Araneus ventricosus TaxID=182803 RepID=A0A4Y2ABE4_ARAVE|nr:hypothetical protein AVEN_53318-1 [Araneus ventricosus]